MTTTKWGHCKNCKHFASPARVPVDQEEAACREPKLVKYELRTFGAGGCNRFELRQGLAPTVERPSLSP